MSAVETITQPAAAAWAVYEMADCLNVAAGGVATQGVVAAIGSFKVAHDVRPALIVGDSVAVALPTNPYFDANTKVDAMVRGEIGWLYGCRVYAPLHVPLAIISNAKRLPPTELRVAIDA